MPNAGHDVNAIAATRETVEWLRDAVADQYHEALVTEPCHNDRYGWLYKRMTDMLAREVMAALDSYESDPVSATQVAENVVVEARIVANRLESLIARSTSNVVREEDART